MDYIKRIERIRHYHQKTKHHFGRYANGPETLDWSMQPDPFRHYEGTDKIELPFAGDDLSTGYCDLYNPGNIKPRDIDLSSIGAMLELSMGLSAWKEYMGDRWALRCNPSSGNLHPTEAYIVAVNINGLPNGVHHYVSYDHTLEQRCAFIFGDNTFSMLQESSLFIGLSSIFWREAWKYGERAFRYCQLDTGHAIASIRFACAMLGWSTEILLDSGDAALAGTLGTDRDQDFDTAEREHAELIMRIFPYNKSAGTIPINTLASFGKEGIWKGKANVLDKHHLYVWPVIDDAAEASSKNHPENIEPKPPNVTPPLLACKTELQAKSIIQRRRSAQRFDGQTSMEAKDFFRVLDSLMPRTDTPPWDTFPWQPSIHIVLFIHRVNGLEPGLYIMLRNETAIDTVKSALSDKMEWLQISSAPEHLNLYRLIKANSQKAAATLSCHQSIASDSAFSLGMLSEFDAALENGPWYYRYLYWEAGMLGQVLYLEAEAMDLQGTGIGCFFDDPVHEMLGIKDTQLQSLYHFTVGGALNDSRLRTLMPYAHLSRKD